MSITAKSKRFLVTLQKLPESKKKIILWTIVVVVGLIMGYFWVNSAEKGVSKLVDDAKSVKLPAVSLPQMPTLPSLDISQTTTPSNK